jgi:hypothetical protein
MRILSLILTRLCGWPRGWQKGDPTCGTGRTPDSDECNGQLGIVLNGCDTDTITAKSGGVRVNNCIAWMTLP